MTLESDFTLPPTRLALIDQLLARYGLVRHGPAPAIAESVLNENFRVETADGARFVRVHKKSRTRERLALEQAVIRWAGEHGIPVNVPLSDPQGRSLHAIDGRLVSLYPWLEGRVPSGGQITLDDAVTLADALGRLHASFREWDGPGLPAGRAGSSWDTAASIASLIRYYPAPGERQLRIQAALREQLSLLESTEPRPSAAFDDLLRGPCHGDYHNRNVILGATGRVLAVVDWEMVGLLPPAFELLRFLTFSRLLDPAFFEACLVAYGRRAPLPADECDAGVEMWWQSLLHDTWVYTARFIQGETRVEQFFAESADHIRRFRDPAYRASLAAALRRLAT